MRYIYARKFLKTQEKILQKTLVLLMLMRYTSPQAAVNLTTGH